MNRNFKRAVEDYNRTKEQFKKDKYEFECDVQEFLKSHYVPPVNVSFFWG